MALHKNITGDDVHVVCTWIYASEAIRTAATGFVLADVGKAAWQTDDDSFWLLADDSPIEWVRIGSGGSTGGISGLYYQEAW
jgi:hypothetical protein